MGQVLGRIQRGREFEPHVLAGGNGTFGLYTALRSRVRSRDPAQGAGGVSRKVFIRTRQGDREVALQYEDSNDLFQINLQQKHLDSFELYVTDDKGRLLAEVDPRQADAGLMSFKCVLRWDHIAANQASKYQPRVITNPRHVPTL